MTTTTNRFAPPKARVEDRFGDEADMWREGKLLVLRQGAHFPDRCIKCNAPSVAPKRRYKLSWHSPFLYVLILAALLLYAIVAAIVRKKATVVVGLCERHQKRVLWGRIVGWGGLVLELGLIGMAVSPAQGDASVVYAILAIFWILVWTIATMSISRLVTPARIDDRYVRLRGCGPAFLGSLPDRTVR